MLHSQTAHVHMKQSFYPMERNDTELWRFNHSGDFFDGDFFHKEPRWMWNQIFILLLEHDMENTKWMTNWGKHSWDVFLTITCEVAVPVCNDWYDVSTTTPIKLLLTLRLLVTNLNNTNDAEKTQKQMTETLEHGWSSESYPMNTNATGFKWFSKLFASLCFGRK